jgi:hypothetical protein
VFCATNNGKVNKHAFPVTLYNRVWHQIRHDTLLNTPVISQQRLKNKKQNPHWKSTQKTQTQTPNQKTTPTNASDSLLYRSPDQASQLWDLHAHKHKLLPPLVDQPQAHLVPQEEDLETHQQHRTPPPPKTSHSLSTAS